MALSSSATASSPASATIWRCPTARKSSPATAASSPPASGTPMAIETKKSVCRPHETSSVVCRLLLFQMTATIADISLCFSIPLLKETDHGKYDQAKSRRRRSCGRRHREKRAITRSPRKPGKRLILSKKRPESAVPPRVRIKVLLVSRNTWDVIASCGKKIGVVDRVEGNAIKLTKKDSPDGQHHFIPTGWVEHVDSHVHLTKNSMETEQGWKSDAMSCSCSN